MFMDLIIPAVILSGIIALPLMRASRIAAKLDPTTNKYILRYNAIHTILGIIIAVELPMILLLFLFPILDTVGMLICTPLVVISIILGGRMIVDSYFYQLELGQDTIAEQGLFRKPRTISWSRIDNVRYEGRTLHIRDRDRNTIKVSQWIIGFPSLLDAIEKHLPAESQNI